jgi:thioesterase domain-containing protein
VSGQVLPYITLAGLLHEDQPVYGLQAGGPAGSALTHDIEWMASRYIRAIRRQQPQGPYRLAGWSAGGLVAYEMARQLLAEDQEVGFVGLIDTEHPDIGADDPVHADTEILLGFLQSRHEIDADTLRRLQAASTLQEGVQEAQRAGLLPPDVQLDEVQRLVGIYRGQRAAMQAYRPQRTAAAVHLYTAADQPGQDPHRGWQGLLGPLLQLRPIGGTHQSIVLDPHAAELARAITTALEQLPPPTLPPHQPLVTIQRGRPGAPTVFCVPGAGAGAIGLCALATALGADVSVYGLQPRGLDEDRVPHASVEAAARSYVQALQAVQPAGPYRLIGHSFGGWVAFEMARQLEGQGAQVVQVGMLDSSDPRLPEPDGRPPHDRLDVLRTLVEVLEQAGGRTLGLPVSSLAGLSDTQQIEQLHRSMVRERLLPQRSSVAVVRRVLRVFGAHLNTCYMPAGPITAELLVVRPQDATPDRRTGLPRDADWALHAPRMTVLTVPGNHMSLLEPPFVQAIAIHLRQAWKNA